MGKGDFGFVSILSAKVLIVHYPGRIGNFGVPSDCEMAFNDALTMIQRLYCRVTSDETPGGRMQLFVSPFRKGDRPLRAPDQAA